MSFNKNFNLPGASMQMGTFFKSWCIFNTKILNKIEIIFIDICMISSVWCINEEITMAADQYVCLNIPTGGVASPAFNSKLA